MRANHRPTRRTGGMLGVGTSSMPRFTLFRRGHLERSFALDGDEILIGRLPGIGIVLDSPTVSRKHARLHRDGTSWILDDLGSVNGTHVGQQRVTTHPLAPGDNVRIEDYVIVYEPPEAVYAEGLAGSAHDVTAPRSLGMTFISGGRFAAREPAEPGDDTPPPGR